MKSLFPLVVLFCVSFSATAQEQRLVHQDVKRKFIVYTPASYAANPQQQFPLVINYHGGGMTMREQMLYTRMNQSAERENFIVVYPQGIKQDWNVNLPNDSKESSDDIGFTEAMLARLKADYRIDQRRVYATGLSRGGFFSLRVATELPHLFAAVAVVGAQTPQTVIDQQAKPARIGVMHIAGTADTIVAFEGKAGHYLSAGESHRYWLKNSGLNGAAASERTVDSDKRDDTEVTHLEQSRDGVSAALVTVRNGGHTWPGADAFNVGLPLGRTSRDIDANAVIWEFLGKHRK
ncbi:dienelactone hydrolase family protein [Massilia violaceinigra]|uniref:Dienelactone hydrolase family protein n=1 Tax=Massilia violaceinigra TaxID=2045208 RepID=A0ABY4A8D2_9BURK|nr:PHB depolymerase family esterase [Massilia violaceinigra]UOD30976.1 dienelactone hydrolase family protein [Massilia violaceinigra]